MAGLQAPLSTLRRAPRDALRMTRGQFGLLLLFLLETSTLCSLPISRRTSVRFFPFREVKRYCLCRILANNHRSQPGKRAATGEMSPFCTLWEGFIRGTLGVQ
jgi:hypothetical protein